MLQLLGGSGGGSVALLPLSAVRNAGARRLKCSNYYCRCSKCRCKAIEMLQLLGGSGGGSVALLPLFDGCPSEKVMVALLLAPIENNTVCSK
jgi:hypothetical protein